MSSKPVGLSASRGAAILGLSKYQTQFEAWQTIMEQRQPGFNEKCGYKYEPFEGNASTRFGHAFEDSIIELAEERLDTKIGLREEAYTSHEFITCHIDGCYIESIGTNYPWKLHEGKTTTEWAFNKNWGEPGTDRVPQEYGIQAQHQMLCTGAEEVIFSVLVFPKAPDEWEKIGWEALKDECDEYVLYREWYEKDKSEKYTEFVKCDNWANTLDQMGFFHQYTVKRNQEVIDLMVEKYTEFWNENILKEIPPDPQNYDDIKRMIPNPCGTIIVDDVLSNWYKEYKDIGLEVKHAENQKENLKAKILERASKMHKELDEDSTDKWLFVNSKGEKVGSYSKTKKGVMFR